MKYNKYCSCTPGTQYYLSDESSARPKIVGANFNVYFGGTKSSLSKTGETYSPRIEAFRAVDEAYKELKTKVSAAKQNHCDNSPFTYQTEPFTSGFESSLKKQFQRLWLNTYNRAKKEKSSSCYAKAVINFFLFHQQEPKTEWYAGVIFGGEDTPELREEYRQFLLSIAPNPKFRGQWAETYLRLEFPTKQKKNRGRK